MLKHSLSVSKVDLFEDGVLVRAGLAVLVFIQEHRRTSELQSELLDSVGVINGQEETLSAATGSDGR